MNAPGSEALRVLCCDSGRGAVGAPEDDGHRLYSRRHVAGLSSRVYDLVYGLHRKVKGHELTDRPQSCLETETRHVLGPYLKKAASTTTVGKKVLIILPRQFMFSGIKSSYCPVQDRTCPVITDSCSKVKVETHHRSSDSDPSKTHLQQKGQKTVRKNLFRLTPGPHTDTHQALLFWKNVR